jgi:hypothetical protein
MDGIDLLRQQALTKRNAAILKAKREYAAALREIRTLQRKLGLKPTGRPRRRLATGDPNLRASTAAVAILREGKPLSIVELTIEVQRRGCRSLDDPRDVAHAIRSALSYYRREFMKDERGRWAVAQILTSL